MQPSPRAAMKSQTQRLERQRQENRSEILSAGISLFAVRGHFGTRLEDVGERAGFSRAAIYLHFPGGKDELYAEALMETLRYRAQVVRETLEARVDEISAGELSGDEAIALVWSAFRRLYEERPDYVQAIAFLGFENRMSVLSEDARKVLASENTAMFHMIDRALTAVRLTHGLPALHTAWSIWSFFLGSIVFARSAHVAQHPEAADLLGSALSLLTRGQDFSANPVAVAATSLSSD